MPAIAPQAGGELVAAGAGDRGERGERRQAEQPAAGALGLDEPAGVGEQRGAHDVVVREERLHEQPATVAAAPGETGAAHEQRHRLLGGPVARRQQLGVDVEEGDDVGPRHPVQHGLGADVDAGGRRQRRCRRR